MNICQVTTYKKNYIYGNTLYCYYNTKHVPITDIDPKECIFKVNTISFGQENFDLPAKIQKEIFEIMNGLDIQHIDFTSLYVKSLYSLLTKSTLKSVYMCNCDISLTDFSSSIEDLTLVSIWNFDKFLDKFLDNLRKLDNLKSLKLKNCYLSREYVIKIIEILNANCPKLNVLEITEHQDSFWSPMEPYEIPDYSTLTNKDVKVTIKFF